MRVGIIGMGNMGSKYAEMIVREDELDMELVAITRVNDVRWAKIADYVSEDLVRVNSEDDMFEMIDKGELSVDAVLIVTPHYSHEEIAVKAFSRGISVLCDKPAGVYTRQARLMWEAYSKAKETYPELKYGYVFHQRTFPIYKKIKEITDSGRYGSIKRVNWVVTDWYRPDAYYESGSWRATYRYDGGGTLLNQCPHNLDLIAWICGEPSNVTAFCSEGKYHNIEVEDDATIYMEWENGATGVFIASTGEAAGVNRLEISMDDAIIVCEHGSLKLGVLDKPEKEYRSGHGDMFAKPVVNWQEIEVEPAEGAYLDVLDAFVKGMMIAPGDEAINSLYISNAAYLSSWQHRSVAIPVQGSECERKFEAEFEAELDKRRK